MLLVGSALERIPGGERVMPLFCMINIYYWCMVAPGSLPYLFLFFLGIAQDTLAGTPLGLSSFMDIVLAWVVINRFHTMGNVSFASVWLRFMIVAALLLAMGWCIMSLYYSRLLPIMFPLLKWGSSCLAYPVIHFLLARLDDKIGNS
ncbi:MAG TPA: rod shape-determining protein MreD [Rickettsiales bacterium]|nr:rod shape-determining protein MreD [Rickettsiales bacterium]